MINALMINALIISLHLKIKILLIKRVQFLSGFIFSFTFMLILTVCLDFNIGRFCFQQSSDLLE